MYINFKFLGAEYLLNGVQDVSRNFLTAGRICVCFTTPTSDHPNWYGFKWLT